MLMIALVIDGLEAAVVETRGMFTHKFNGYIPTNCSVYQVAQYLLLLFVTLFCFYFRNFSSMIVLKSFNQVTL